MAIFPSDHYVSDDSAFMLHVATALRAVDRSPQLTVLLGIAPDGPETEYGWIEPGSPLALPDAGIGKISRIRRFIEKPSPEVARELYDRNYLWNSFVLIANPTTLLSLIARALPELYGVFSGIRPFFGGAAENEILQIDLSSTAVGGFLCQRAGRISRRVLGFARQRSQLERSWRSKAHGRGHLE